MGPLFKIMLAGATLSTTRTAPRTRAAATLLGPRGPTHPLHKPARAREDAQNVYTPVCSSHAAHWSTSKDGGYTQRCGAAGATQEACRSGEWSGVPSVAAIGPFGGRGVPSGGWALTLTHTLDSNLGTATEVIDGRVAKEDGEERLEALRSAGRLGGGSATAAGQPTRGTAMLRWSHRLCAAVDQWGYCADNSNFYVDSERITHKNKIKSVRYKTYSRKNKEKKLTGGVCG